MLFYIFFLALTTICCYTHLYMHIHTYSIYLWVYYPSLVLTSIPNVHPIRAETCQSYSPVYSFYLEECLTYRKKLINICWKTFASLSCFCPLVTLALFELLKKCSATFSLSTLAYPICFARRIPCHHIFSYQLPIFQVLLYMLFPQLYYPWYSIQDEVSVLESPNTYIFTSWHLWKFVIIFISWSVSYRLEIRNLQPMSQV